MTTFTLPLGPSAWTPGKILNDEMFVSITGAVQVSARTGNRHLLTLTYDNLVSTRRKTMQEWERSLQGRVHRGSVAMSKLGWVRTGNGGGTPLLNGAHSAGARTLTVDGASAGITNWLTGSDYITVGNELKEVTAACNSDGSGNVTISIWPELHKAYADNTAVNISTPFGVFFQREPAMYGQITPYVAGDYLLESMVLSLEEDVLA